MSDWQWVERSGYNQCIYQGEIGRAVPMLLGSQAARRPIRLSEEADTLASLLRSLSAVSLTFIIMVTPWAILQAGQAGSFMEQ